MIPIAADICLHHFATHHVIVIAAITLEKSFLLSCDRRMVSLIESLFDQVDDSLALLFRKDGLWKTSIEQTCYGHWVLLLSGWGEESTKIHIVCKIWRIVLILGIRVAKAVISMRSTRMRGLRLTLRSLVGQSGLQVKSCLFVDH